MDMRIGRVGEAVGFIVMYADKPMVEAYTSEDKKGVNINRLTPDSIEQSSSGDELDLERVYRFLESRCYEDGRASLKEIPAQAGMSSNNPREQVKITHGITWEDLFWIRFPGETLAWEDVRRKR